MPNVSKITPSEFRIIGHRGAAGLAPENTMTSFRCALSYGLDAIELDVHALGGELIVIHDSTVDRTTDGTGALSRFTVEELAKLDAGGEGIPTAERVLRELPNHVWINIELKGAGTAPGVVNLIRSSDSSRPLLVSSFRVGELEQFRAIDDQTPLALLLDRWSGDPYAIASALDAQAINISGRMANRRRVQTIRERGYDCYVYTVNDFDVATAMRRHGASGVFTDRPDLINPKTMGLTVV